MSEYDTFARDFSATRQHAWPEFDMFLPLLRRGDRVLDLGCGNGRLREFINKSTSQQVDESTSKKIIPEGNYFGFDISTELLRIAEKKFPHDHFFRGDFSCTLPFGGDNFNAVVAIASFHHLLSRKPQILFLQECIRILKPGSVLFMTTWQLPRKFFWQNILRGRLKNWIIPFGADRHSRTYRRTSEKELTRLLKKTGFEVVSVRLFQQRNFVAIARKPK
ncbi:class I SAM-dependent methyltransferase [Candidatus Gracilibacteria bacterium]|nr:class I SAM-dependent methyltransferase [Candidatus Gracilibacteria bacterium]